MQLPTACSQNRRLFKTEGRDDWGVVGFGVFAVDGEGRGLVVENFVVDLRTQVVFQQVSGHKHVVKHLATALVKEGVPDRLGKRVLDRHQDPFWPVQCCQCPRRRRGWS